MQPSLNVQLTIGADWQAIAILKSELDKSRNENLRLLAALKQISLNCQTIEEATRTARNAIGKDGQ